jgi:phage terminase small subunit
MAKLTDKQRIFIEEYLRSWNATEAARVAGYKDPEQAGYENKKKQEVQAQIQAHIDEIYPAGKVLSRLADHADGTMEDFIDIGRETLDLDKAKAAGKLHLIKKFTRSETKYGTNVSLELYDAQAALVHLGKHHGLFTDRTEHSGSITVDRAEQMTEEEIDAELKRRGIL